MIDFENMEPGTLLLVNDGSPWITSEVCTFCLGHSDGILKVRCARGSEYFLTPENIQCVVPPKPEIEGWEAVEFREPADGEWIESLSTTHPEDCGTAVNMDDTYIIRDSPGFGRRRWILKRKETEQVEPAWLPVAETITKPILEKPMKEKSSFKSKLKSLLWWSVAPPTLLAKHTALKSNWIGWACMAAAVSWYAWLASTGQVEVPTVQWPLKW